jgi:signal transduction histidine kinase
VGRGAEARGGRVAGPRAPRDPGAAPRTSRAIALTGAAGLASGLVYAAIVLASDHVHDRGLEAAIGLLVGWSFIGTGLYAWWRRPANRTGALMAGTGFAWFATGVSASDDDLVFTIGIALDALFPVMVGHLLMAFPTGRVQTPAERVAVVAAYFTATALQLPALLFEEPGKPLNLLIVEPDASLSDALDAAQYVFAVAVIAYSVVLLTRRRWPPSWRRALAPVLWTGGAAFGSFLVAKGYDAATGEASPVLEHASEALVATVPVGFLAGLLRTRLAQAGAVSELVERLGQVPGEEPLRAALADALGDPSIALAYWLPESERFVDALGLPVTVEGAGWTEVELRGRRIAAIAHDPSLADEPQLVRTAGAAAALALENQRLSAELRARIEELRASRARLVEAGDAERRRLERDLHDGAQSRLVALALKLKLARMKLEPGSDAAALLDESSAELQASLDELRELARGIHPAILTDHGLAAAVRALANRASVPVELTIDVAERLAPPIETAVYFVVAEALTNVAKYADASRAEVSVARGDSVVVVEVTDDGRGGADLTAGSGLRGLSDRVAALDGRLRIDSPPGAGTRLRAEIPLASS